MRKQNGHMDHFEDRIVLAQKNPIHWVDDIIAGRVKWSRKWDGAPSVFVGRDEDGIYIAKKGIFNKNPKVYHCTKDIFDDIPNEHLANKLNEVLMIMQDCDLQNGDLVQGDLLFTRDDLQSVGNKRTQFQANTIVYQTELDLSRKWIGIVWHTMYIEQQAYYGHDIKSMVGSSYGLFHFNADDEINPLDDKTKSLLRYMKKEYIQVKEDFDLDPLTVDLWVSFINYQIKNELFSVNGNIDGFAEYVLDHMTRAVDLVKREATKQKRVKMYAPVFHDLHQMVVVDKLHSILYRMKMVILESLNSHSSIDTYLKTSKGLTPTGHEGYVAINEHGIDVVKIVNRQEFSYANFSPDVIKGWNKE
jgi:hypothetical protein|tara:strand:- start:2256 stop:3335 length:1080 start_codon:yes stop_codon:yes gene_type:complete